MNFHVVIPARFASTRLPGKPLLDICGKPMIQHVYESAARSAATSVTIATDDTRIAAAVRRFGGQVCITRADHESGTDRLQEVATLLGYPPEAVVVNVQGDEPLLPPEVIDQVAANLVGNPASSAATLCEPIRDLPTLFDANVVKVVADESGQALYFSRAPIPWVREQFSGRDLSDIQSIIPAPAIHANRHIGLYAYRVALLHDFVQWPVALLESLEKLEQLRILAKGHRMHVAPACTAVPGGVDTAADLERVRAIMGERV